MRGTKDEGGSGGGAVDRTPAEDVARREELEEARAWATKVAIACLVASVVVGIGFVIDLMTLSASECGPPAVNPGWFVIGMVGSALAGTIAAVSARSKERALYGYVESGAILPLGIMLLIVTILVSIVGVMAAIAHSALGCM